MEYYHVCARKKIKTRDRKWSNRVGKENNTMQISVNVQYKIRRYTIDYAIVVVQIMDWTAKNVLATREFNEGLGVAIILLRHAAGNDVSHGTVPRHEICAYFPKISMNGPEVEKSGTSGELCEIGRAASWDHRYASRSNIHGIQ